MLSGSGAYGALRTAIQGNVCDQKVSRVVCRSRHDWDTCGSNWQGSMRCRRWWTVN